MSSTQQASRSSRTKTIPVSSHMQALVIKKAISMYKDQIESLDANSETFDFVGKEEIVGSLGEIQDRISDLVYFDSLENSRPSQSTTQPAKSYSTPLVGTKKED